MEFSRLVSLVEDGVWGDAFWYNWKTGKYFPVPFDSTHGECLRMNREVFGLDGNSSHGDNYYIVLSTGWAAVHNYSRLLLIEIGTNVSVQKTNDLVSDIVNKVEIGDSLKPIEVHCGNRVIGFGTMGAVDYQ